MSDAFDVLMDDWFDGCLSEADEDRLQNWLKDHPDHMPRFVEANIRDEMLREALQAELVAQETWRKRPDIEPSSKDPQSVPAMRRRFQIWGSIAAIAATILFAAFLAGNREQRGVGVKVVAWNDATIDSLDVAPAVGDRTTISRFRLKSGSMEIELESGVQVELIAPVEAELLSSMRMRLCSGRIGVDVGPRGKGFTVETDAGQVVDLGTRFGVEADREGEARVAVFSGSVQIHPYQTTVSKDFVTLTEGEALRFSARAGLRRWQNVALAADRAGLSDAPKSGVIVEVRDNLGEGELRPFYGVIAGGMRTGALAFTDKPNPVWMKMPRRNFPSELEGADLVRTYHQFRNKKNYELKLTLSEPAELFVLLVTPSDPPSWLTDRFEHTGLKVRSGPWHQGLASHPAVVIEPDGNFLDFEVWKCGFEPGEVTLGRPREFKVQGFQSLMYGVAVKSRSK